jgi:hypothetical protein
MFPRQGYGIYWQGHSWRCTTKFTAEFVHRCAATVDTFSDSFHCVLVTRCLAFTANILAFG